MMMADILGDWREELITVLAGELRIYTTTIPAKDRRVCLMQDLVYRAEVAHRSMGYEQSPVTGYYLGVRAADSPNATPVIQKITQAKKTSYLAWGMRRILASCLSAAEPFEDVTDAVGLKGLPGDVAAWGDFDGDDFCVSGMLMRFYYFAFPPQSFVIKSHASGSYWCNSN